MNGMYSNFLIAVLPQLASNHDLVVVVDGEQLQVFPPSLFLVDLSFLPGAENPLFA